MPDAISISIDLSELLQLAPIAQTGLFTNLAAAVETTAQVGVERWQRAVLKAPLWDGERRAYAATIKYTMSGAYEAEIASDYKYVEDIESGRPPRDLKRMLDTSMKVRVSKKGKRYLIIPMRHNAPGGDAHAPEMPSNVYAEAKNLSASSITGHGTRVSGTGAHDIKTKSPYLVRSRAYQWGGRLPAGMAPKLKPTHKTDPYAGMVRFKEKTGGSTYLTFRVMVEGSSGWIVPAKPGLFIAKAVADSLQRTAEADFGAAMQRDLAG
jgi:hypothetical protein